MVPPEDQLQRQDIHDSRHKGHLPLAAVRLRQSQVKRACAPRSATLSHNENQIPATLSYCSNISADDMLYTETDLEESMDKIETINFHEVKEVAGIKFWCYHAGHVLGAAMFMIEIAGVKVTSVEFSCRLKFFTFVLKENKQKNTHFLFLQLLYTGDFSRQEDRHLMAAEIPSVKPDILIIVRQIIVITYEMLLSTTFCMNPFFLLCRSRRTAPTFTKRGKSEKLVSVTQSMTLSTEKVAV